MVLFRLFFTFSCLPIRYFVVCPFFGLDPKGPKKPSLTLRRPKQLKIDDFQARISRITRKMEKIIFNCQLSIIKNPCRPNERQGFHFLRFYVYSSQGYW